MGNNAGILQTPEWGGKAEVSLTLQPPPIMHKAKQNLQILAVLH